MHTLHQLFKIYPINISAYLLFESYIEFAWVSSMYESIPDFQRWWMAFFAEASQLPIEPYNKYKPVQTKEL